MNCEYIRASCEYHTQNGAIAASIAAIQPVRRSNSVLPTQNSDGNQGDAGHERRQPHGHLRRPEDAHGHPEDRVVQRRMDIRRLHLGDHPAERLLGLDDADRLIDPEAAARRHPDRGRDGAQADHGPQGLHRAPRRPRRRHRRAARGTAARSRPRARRSRATWWRRRRRRCGPSRRSRRPRSRSLPRWRRATRGARCRSARCARRAGRDHAEQRHGEEVRPDEVAQVGVLLAEPRGR